METGRRRYQLQPAGAPNSPPSGTDPNLVLRLTNSSSIRTDGQGDTALPDRGRLCLRPRKGGVPDLSITSVAVGNPIGSGFTLASTTCSGQLAAGSACDLVASFTPTAFGQDGGALTVHTDHGPFTIGTNWLEGHGGARLSVTMTGSGAGYVASDGGGVPDIDCGATCSGLFTDGPMHTLTESTAGTFGGWGGDGAACGSAASSCMITLSTMRATVVRADFEP